MKIMKIATETVNEAASRRGFTPEEYVSRIASISCGHKVCAHFDGTESGGSISVFSWK